MVRMAWFYILECGDGSLYAGVTYDVKRRLSQHQAGKGARYTRSHQPVRLRYVECFESLNEAMRREAEIRRWPRDKKLSLIGSQCSDGDPAGMPD